MTARQEPVLTVYHVIDKSTGTKYRIDSTASDIVCALAQLPEEQFPSGQFLRIVTYEIDSMDEYPELVRQLFPGNNYFEPPRDPA